MKHILVAAAFVALIAGWAITASADGDGIEKTYSRLFEGYDGCFMLFDLNQGKLVMEYNPDNRCVQRIPANSTFKVPLSLMAFDQGIITENSVFTWDGKARDDFPDWNRDQTPASWQKYSVVWVSQQLTPRIGLARIRKYLADFAYGNQDFTGDPGKNNGLTNAWLSSSLKISAAEQLEFLKRMESYQLPVSATAIDQTKRILYQGTLNTGADYYAKTGSGWKGRSDDGGNQGKLRDGWYVGIVEKGSAKYVFVTTISDKSPDPTAKLLGGPIAKGIALTLLNGYLGR